MNKCKNIPENVHLYALLADMKDIDYKNLLSITIVIDLLIEKGIISAEEIVNKFNELDHI